MPPLQNIFPVLPATLPAILLTVLGLLGALALSYAVLLEAERNQDAVFVLGSAALFVYAFHIHSRILMFAFGLLFVVSGLELVQILRGKHQHTPTKQ